MLYAPQSAYYHARGSCYLCGKTDDLVDTEVQIEGEGVLALCRGCVEGDLLRTLGVDLAALRNAAEASEAAIEELEASRAEVRRLKGVITKAKNAAKQVRETAAA